MESLEYRYCELFVKCYSIAKRTHEKKYIKAPLDNWIISNGLEWGKIGNLARDCIESKTLPSVKYKYCARNYRYKKFKKEAFSFIGEGVALITLELIAHPCYCGFDKYVSIDALPDNWCLIADSAFRHKMMDIAR